MIEMLLSDIPIALVDDATRRIGRFLIGFVRLTTDSTGEDGQLIGSGTLVRIGEIHGILTAQHVLEVLPVKGRIGLVLPKSADVERHAAHPTILAENTHRLGFPRGPVESVGPDLAMLALSPTDVAWLSASKSFFNLEHWRAEILQNQRDIAHQLWALSGFPDLLTSDASPQRGYDLVKEFRGLSFFSFVEPEISVREFDYVTLKVGYGGDASDPPRSFGGFSGGGLWLVELTGDTIENVRVGRCLLSGVAFYQSALIDNERSIRCHWRRSVYEQLFKLTGAKY